MTDERAEARAAENPYADVPVAPAEVDLAAMAEGREVELELGFGRGQFILARAAARPGSLLVGLEVRRKWVGLVAARAARAELDNVVVWHGDARRVLSDMGPDGSVSWVFLHFPDPWWKKRHQKRRVLVPETAGQIARLLRPGGRLLVQTDVADRGDLYLSTLEAEPALVAVETDLSESLIEEHSHREKKCLEAGLPVSRLLYEKR